MMQTTENAAPMMRFPYGKRRRKMGESKIEPQMPRGMGRPMLKMMGKKKMMMSAK